MSEEKVLPPFVFGKLRGHLTVKVDEIFWVKSNPGNVFVELLWWGEKESHIFKPACINQPGSLNEEDTSITFNIRTSFLLFENYIKKLGKLVFGIFKYPSKEHIGNVTVWNPFKTIFSGKCEQGYYPIFNKNRLRIGDLRISFELWMAKKDNSEPTSESEKDITKNPIIPKKRDIPLKEPLIKDIGERDDPLSQVLNRGKELRDAMTMSVLEDSPLDNIENIISYGNTERVQSVQGSELIDANKLMDFLMGKELPPDEEVLAIKTLRSVSPTQSVVNQELKTRLTSAQSCRCCFKNNNSCSSCTSRVLSSANSVSCSRPQTSHSVVSHSHTANQNDEEIKKSKHVIELVNCFKLVIQCLHLNSLGAKKVRGVSSKPQGKVKKKPGLYYMIEHHPGAQTNLDKEKPWNLKQTRFVSRKINDNEIIFGESNFLIDSISGGFSWPKVLKQLNGTTLKIYWRYHNQRLPCYLGSVCIKDDSVTPSGLFSTFTLPVNSNSGITVGHLSLLLELGHNKKTFGSHLLSCELRQDHNASLDDKDKEVTCQCRNCKPVDTEIDALWGREMEKRARDLMISCHHHCCQSSSTKSPPEKFSSDDRRKELQAKSVISDSQKSTTISPESQINKETNKRALSPNGEPKYRLVNIPTNIPDSLKSESSDGTSSQSDSIKNDLRLDEGNIRPRCVTSDASCQVTLDRSFLKETKQNTPPNSLRLCKSCLAMSDSKPESLYYNQDQNMYSSNLPSWANNSRYCPHPMFIPHREPPQYDNWYRSYHPSCHCCPSQIPSSHKCCYEMASAQLNASRHFDQGQSHLNEKHYDLPSRYSSLPKNQNHPQESITVHELSISIDKICDFPMFNQELNEDADCFVDYTFPTNQNNKVVVPHKRHSTEVSVINKDVSFSTVTKHTLTLPSSQNLSQMFSSLTFPSLDFNVWCRFYRSTPVDHVVAKAILPVGRICALREEFETSSGLRSVKDKVRLPLLTVASPLSVQYPTKVSGSMEVTLLYKNFTPESTTYGHPSTNFNSESKNDIVDDLSHECGRGSSQSASKHCCSNINYNTIQRSPKNYEKNDAYSLDLILEEHSKCTKPNIVKEKSKEDRALSPILELSDPTTPRDQIENLCQSLERLAAEADVCKERSAKEKGSSDSSVNSYLEKCQDIIQLESSSDEEQGSIIPTVNPKMKKRKDKNRMETNQSVNQTSKKGNPRTNTFNSDNLASRMNQHLDDVNLSDDDTLKSVSSVNSDDSSSHVGFIAFNKDFVKNDSSIKKKGSQENSKRSHKILSSKDKNSVASRCTQTTDYTTNINKKPGRKTESGSFFKVRIEVERAINLPLLTPFGGITKQKPSSYVSLDAYIDGCAEHLASEIVYNSTDPVWNASWNVMLPTEYLYKCDKKLVLNVMLLSHVEEGPVGTVLGQEENRSRLAEDTLVSLATAKLKQPHRPKGAVRKQALIDLTSLCAGLRLLFGWYSLINESTPCSGQIKVKITPLEDVSGHKSVWFKEYTEWEKNHHKPKPSSAATYASSKLDDFKIKKLVDSIDSKASGQSLPEIKKTDSIDRDLVYISLNQKLSELERIPESFKTKKEANQQSVPRNMNTIYTESLKKSSHSETPKDLSDLHIDKDISYVNKLLSEIPLFRSGNVAGTSNYKGESSKIIQSTSNYPETSSNYDSNRLIPSNASNYSTNVRSAGVGFNFQKHDANIESCLKDTIGQSSALRYAKNTVIFSKPEQFTHNLSSAARESISLRKRTQEALNSSFNASDILDLEEIKGREIPTTSFDVETDEGIDRNLEDVSKIKESERNSTSESKSDEKSSNNNISQYKSFSPDLTVNVGMDSGSSNQQSDCIQACSGESQSCIFNNKKAFCTYTETGEFRAFSPAPSSRSNSEQIDANKYKSDFRINYSGLTPPREIEDNEENSRIKDVETLSGHSSLCTDDQSLNYSDNLHTQGVSQHHSLTDNPENLNSDLIEEASSEIDRILKELNQR